MWTLDDEFDAAIEKLNLGHDTVCLLEPDINRKLYDELLNCFVNGGDRRWWWEAFKSSFRIEIDGYVLDQLNRMMPDLSQKVLLMIEDNYKPYYPIYDIQPTSIAPLLNECAAEFEYYIISKDFSWLLCENHHDTLFGIGELLKVHLSLLSL
jgi:hypothetical protein